MKYDFSKIEKKWQKAWKEEGVYEPFDFAQGKPSRKRRGKPFYNLMMFPYPSAEGLHVGNMYAFTGSDIYGRFQRMQGLDVFQPIGLDGFGIHSENYAIKKKTHPAKQAKVSEKNFYKQLEAVGNGFAWKEKLETYDPEYYKWTQRIVAQLFDAGLVERKKAPVNWCSSCKTVLADEQVIDNHCERCSTQIERKELEQWFFKITKYADKLLNNLEKIDWSERVKIAQKNWIGRSEGALIKFSISNSQFSIKVFTTRPDTLYGATYMVLAPEHELVGKLKDSIKNWKEVQKYVKKAGTKTEQDRIAEGKLKTGIELKGVKAVNPANSEEVSVWIADYALSSYGTGAIMAVPAHDARDFEFAKKFDLPIRYVIAPFFGKPRAKAEFRKTISAIVRRKQDGKVLLLKWKKLDWIAPPVGGIDKGESAEEAAEREVLEETGYRAKAVRLLGGPVESHFFAENKNVWRHRLDQAVLLEAGSDKRTEVSKEELERHESVWLSPKEALQKITHEENKVAFQYLLSGSEVFIGSGKMVNSGKFDGMESGKAKKEITSFVKGKMQIQYKLRDWLISRQRYWGPPIPLVFCEKCAHKGKTKGEKMNPGWMSVSLEDLPVKLPALEDFQPKGPSTSSGQVRGPLDKVEKFWKTKCPKCNGEARRETDVSDTFLDSAWYYIGYLNLKEPFDKAGVKKWLPVDMYIGGAEHSVLHLLYSRFLAMALKDLGLLHYDEPFAKFRAHGLLIKEGAKMSKSKGNVVNPDEYIDKFGADALRMYLMFLAPFEQGGDFRDQGILGITRFLERVWRFYNSDCVDGKDAGQVLHQTVKKVTDDVQGLQYNTAISQLMICLNAFEEKGSVSKNNLEVFLKLLALFAPHVTEELWREVLGNKKSIHLSEWPKFDSKKIEEDVFQLVVQINGKTRAAMETKKGITQASAKKVALGDERVLKYLDGKKIKKTIFVKDRLINFVV